MCKYAISAIYLQKYKKYSEKSDYMDGFCLQGELNLPLFYMIEGYFEKPKSLMILMAVTLMNGKRPKTFICFSDETLPCLSHCFCSPIVGLYQQWTLVILHNLAPD